MTSMRDGQLRSTAVDKNVKLFWKFFHTPRVKKRSKSLVIAARGEFFLLATVRGEARLCCPQSLDFIAHEAHAKPKVEPAKNPTNWTEEDRL